MKLKQGLVVAVAALAVYALPVSSAFAGNATTELHYCEGAPGQPGECAGVVVPETEWVQPDYAVNSCLEGIPDWTAADAENCIKQWNPNAAVTRSRVDDATTSHRRLKQRHHAKRHHRTGATARASRS
jgi:hypothetical protein